uniref:Uncharacterized protein n=1 Tax=viral metagenome TaxID=1070528 RepID=A0A6C0LXD3_9ZZZZ
MSSNIVWLENPIVNGDFKCNGILNASQFVNNIMGTTYSQEVVEFMAGDIQDALSTQILKILNNIPGQNATAFQGQNMKVTNWTEITSFDPFKKNKYGVDSNPKQLDSCIF